ncbi:hypothetical protein C0995_001613 [Termitomyces sp. Mi166|nr:hypothetical protein C0995_001613 [Termitomyces sp. Mi166\
MGTHTHEQGSEPKVRSDVRASLLGNPKVREAFLTTDAEDDTSFEDKPFATMTLLSNKRLSSSLDSQGECDGIQGKKKFMLGPVSCVELPSAFGRDGLCVDIIPPAAPHTVCRLINVHLDSCQRLANRTQQLKILANVLREPGCSGGFIAGDLNSISSEEQALVDDNGLDDAWLALHGNTDPDAPTWSVGRERKIGLKPKRLHKVGMMGLRAEEMEILHPGIIEVPKPGGKSDWLEWTTHQGPRLRDFGWIEDSTIYYVHPTRRVTADIDLRDERQLDAINAYFERHGEGASAPAGLELWFGEDGVNDGRRPFRPPLRFLINHGLKVATFDQSSVNGETSGSGRVKKAG